ncbi:MAG: GNAT family N-acetyltransferase [Anaerolineae bacterium]
MSETSIRDLGDGLILRRATKADAETLATFNARVHSDQGWDSPDEPLQAWVKDLMEKPHPTFDGGGFLIVEDVATGQIVSSSNLIPQTWSYAGIEFGVGRPELVGTDPDYRRRGLVRAQFEVLHAWSAKRGHKVQAITGIPWYYRQFGYEMALDLYGTRSGGLSDIPKLKEGDTEPYTVRSALPEDLDFVAQTEALGQQRHLIRCVRDDALWHYELEGRSGDNAQVQALRVIEGFGGEPVGYLAHPMKRWGSRLYLKRYELKKAVSWWAVTPSVLRYLKQVGADYEPYAPSEESQPFEGIALGLGREHPAYRIVQAWLPKVGDPYAWYLRVADLPDFLMTIAPALEARLAGSALVGHSGTLKLDFYRDGIKVVLEGGRIVDVVPWPLNKESDHDRRSSGAYVRFPDLTFLQVLFGYRSLDELIHAHADCGGNLEGRLLVGALFRKQPSDVWPVS